MPADGNAFAGDLHARGNRARLMPALDRVHGGDTECWAQRIGVNADAILDFSASINPLGPSSAARKAFYESYNTISRYPDPYGELLKNALAKVHCIDTAEVLLGNGSTQLIYLMCAALRPRKALIVEPAFSEYANALALGGTEIHHFPLDPDDEFHFALERLSASWDESCDVIFLATPNSFTGKLITHTDIARLAEIARTRKSILIIDEAFLDFTGRESVAALARKNRYLIVLRSLTKFFSLPGLRLGYLLGEASRVAQLALFQEPWSVNTVALTVALACFEDAAFALKTQRWLGRERDFLFGRLSDIRGIRVVPSEANFLLCRMTRPDMDAIQLQGLLARQRILIRPCVIRGLGPRYFRVAVRRRQENRRLIAALEEWSG